MVIDPNEERVLVVAPTGRDAELVCGLLKQAMIVCANCGNGDTLQAEIETGAGALLLVVEAINAELLTMLTETVLNQPPWSDLPIVLLGEQGHSLPADRLRAHLGSNMNITLLERPVHSTTLVTLFQSMLQARRRQYQVRDLVARAGCPESSPSI